ncbi:hypothetical protein CSPHI_01925 [Corynebacterium sphenisci DSM 44792]|uniref:Uncharacterized protein n=1 Tax=Corynebacterium sphenisci DSM 44792 TaxID=1437874 RepID=A0A1L7CW74_9CORY|nr:hypothetical protein [Corynebacterium sphenisci]APT90042.1 hypothetical protein CSPHI_01925 [Corynebacterium sphenisci DSM 44792]
MGRPKDPAPAAIRRTRAGLLAAAALALALPGCMPGAMMTELDALDAPAAMDPLAVGEFTAPYVAPAGTEWTDMGPYDSRDKCMEVRRLEVDGLGGVPQFEPPVDRTECFAADDGWYYLALRRD